MNKRGDFPTVLLFVIAIVISIMALITFAGFSGGYDGKSKEFSQLMEKASFNQNYVIERAKFIAKETIDCKSGAPCAIADLQERFMAIADKYDLQLDGQGNFYGEIRARAGDFNFGNINGEYVLKADKLFVTSVSGSEKTKNSITRHFDICMKFDDIGSFKGNC